MKRLAAFSLITLLGACSAPATVGERTADIINGTDDTGDPSVVLVVAQLGGNMGSLCTGSVVSPHVVLTAAHCVDPDVLGTTTAKFTIFTGAVLPRNAPPPASQLLAV